MKSHLVSEKEQPYPVEIWIPKRSHRLFVVTDLMRNGLGCRLLPSIYQDFGFLPGVGHPGPNPSKSSSCVISQTVISVDIAIHIARLLLIQYRLNKQGKNIFNERFSFAMEPAYLPLLWHPSTLTQSPNLLVLIVYRYLIITDRLGGKNP